jgi:asparagine synthase (glutamine-hydrolysing)
MLLKSIDRHLIADVPVGVYLSGGMDSSTVAYYAQKILNGRLKTFTIAFKEDTFDEQKKARQTADRLGSEHHEIDFDANDFFDTTIEAVRKMDAPFSDSSYIPAYYLNKYARNTIKVALGGEGGDEIFIGYPIYRAHELVKYLLAIPKSLRKKVVYPIINNVKVSYNNETWVYRLKKFIEAEEFLDNPFYTQQVWLGAFGPAYLNQLFKNEYHPAIGLDSLFDNIDLYREDREGNESLIDGLVRQTQHKYLMDDGLTKTDRASMAHSLEMRAPLLDGELVEWVNRLPFNNKFMNGQTKIVLRKLMKGKIPDGILNGRKQGFTPPIAEWFVNNLQKSIKDYLFSEDEFFVKSYIDRLWNEHVSGRQNHRKLLWTLFVWKLWSEKNLK